MVRQTAQGDPCIAAFPAGMNLNGESQAMNARNNEFSTPSKIFRAPLIAPCIESASISADEFASETANAMGLTGDILRARCAYDENVAKAGYFLAHRRGFEPGHELGDGIAAEAQIANASKPSESTSEEHGS